ncbi:hypothetical protein [Micromonospora sp. NPDC048839]|uniref:pentapeptide repeat-containing protein n=1 Tax=Micromonospora sp. NPDC048839 TaxID=3155641 RepID=UPI0033DC8580
MAALLVVTAMVAAALWFAGWPSVKRDAIVTPATLFDLLKLVFAVVAGIGGVAALVVAYRRQRVAEHTNALAEFAHQLAHAADLRAEMTNALAEAADERAKVESDRNGIRLFNERFAKGSEQLGSEKAAVRLAGVYAMAGLGDDWRDGRQTCIDVLCAYLRMPYTPPESADSEEAARIAREEREVRHTVIRLIGGHLRVADAGGISWSGHDFDFTGAVFDGGSFADARFSGGHARFDGAKFCGLVHFNNAEFSSGEVSFQRAEFASGVALFNGIKLMGGLVNFALSKFSGGSVWFSNSSFCSGTMSFRRAKFTGGKVSFSGVKLSGADINFAMSEIPGGAIYFDRAQLFDGGVYFDGASFAGGEVSFDSTEFSGGDLSFINANILVPPRLSRGQDGQFPPGVHWPEA